MTAQSKRGNEATRLNSADGPDPNADEPQDIETLKKRFASLRDKKTIAEADRRHALDRLEQLKKEARETYGTDDLEELKKKLAEMKEENRTRRLEYEKQMNAIEHDLAQVDSEYERALREQEGGGGQPS